MEIGLYYSRGNSRHRKTVDFVKKAVENLGISAIITETNQETNRPKLIVDGFDLFNQVNNGRTGQTKPIPYKMVEQLLERTAW